MTPDLDLTVVIPTLNEADCLPAALDSVTRALGSSAEIIVVDGGSHDGTQSAIAQRARLVESAPGRARQLNAGAERANGAVLLFLHADTRLGPGAGRSLARVLTRPEVVGGCFTVALHGPSAHRPIARLLTRAINARTRLFRSATGDQAIFVRRWAFERLGGFPPVDMFEDVVFYRRLRQLGDVVSLDPPVVTSDRRWRRHGYLRTIATHLALRSAFFAGATPDRLARLYTRGPKRGS